MKTPNFKFEVDDCELQAVKNNYSTLDTVLGNVSTVSTNFQKSRAPLQNTLWVAKNGLDTNTGTVTDPFLTISAAMSAAVSGTEICVMPGTYTENVNLIAGVFLHGGNTRAVYITGNMTASFNGSSYCKFLDLQASSGSVVTISGTNATEVQFDDVNINSTGSGLHCVSYTNTNSSSQFIANDGAWNVYVSANGGAVLNTSSTAAGSIQWYNITARLLDNPNNICISLGGSVAFVHTLDQVVGQTVVSNSASNTSTFISHITNTVPTIVTSSSGVTAFFDCIETSTAIPIITGNGSFSYAAITYGSTGKVGASTINGGQGALPLDFAPLKWRSGALRPTPIDGLIVNMTELTYGKQLELHE